MENDDTNQLFGSSSISNQTTLQAPDDVAFGSSQISQRGDSKINRAASSSAAKKNFRNVQAGEQTPRGRAVGSHQSQGGHPSMSTKSLSIVVTINQSERDQMNKHSGKTAGLVNLLSVIYAMVVITFGILFPLAETIKKVWQKSIHVAMFELYIYGVATAFMIYLQVAIVAFKCPCNKNQQEKNNATDKDMTNNNIDIIDHLTAMNIKDTSTHDTTDTTTDHDAKALHAPDDTLTTTGKSHHSMLSVDRRKDRDREFSDSRESRKARHSEIIPPPVTAFLRFNSSTRLPCASTVADLQSSETSMPFKSSDLKSDLLNEIPRVEEIRYLEEEVTEEVFIHLDQLGTVFSHHGSSFFLRIGTLMFGVGHMIFTILEMQTSLQTKADCAFPTHWWVPLTRFIFVFVQTFVIFKHPTVPKNDGKDVILRFGFMHVIATNLCIWIKTLFSEIVLETKYIKQNTTDPHSLVVFDPNCTDAVFPKMAPYLFPFVLEYSLLCISVIGMMHWSLADKSKNIIQKGLTNLFKIDVFVIDRDDSIKTEEDDHEEHGSMFGKSHRGIFSGFIMVAAVIVVIAFFNVTKADVKKCEYLYLSSDLVMLLLLMVAALLGAVLTNPLSFIKKPSTIDDALLIVAMFGGIIYHVALLMASLHVLTQPSNHHFFLGVEILRILKSIIGFAFVIFQVILVTSGLRRYPSRRSQVVRKPGRGVITFLVIANIGSWIFHSILSKDSNLQETAETMFGKLPWIILLNISLPLLLFFFFHSSVCLADIWHQAYQPLHSKLHKPSQETAVNTDEAIRAIPDASHFDGDLSPAASNGPYNASQQNLDRLKQPSVLNFLNPLIRSVSVSQLSQTPILNSSTRHLDSKYIHGSLTQLPDHSYPSLSKRKHHFNRINKAPLLINSSTTRVYNLDVNNNNNSRNSSESNEGNDDDYEYPNSCHEVHM